MEIEYFKLRILPLKDKLFRKALSITESAEEARDVVQEVMMRLWDKRGEWSSISNIEVYSMVIAKNMALDRIRRSGYRSASIDNAKPPTYSDLQHPDRSLERKESAAMVWKVIGMLPLRQQEAIRLREIEELSYAEMAVQMNLSEAQIKITLFRARQKIKEIYLKNKLPR